ncbi:Crp/Fnr family transcriptional regulator [Desulfovibrio sp. UCD-KL4C]|uniref:Crp/Fnr family transcriptional regulator n=1 Tax=Desulfovibrio sp. UCD-KL4C TaxID=2578120 RepID=UPI0025B91E54|nr:Crp/Fnr family transcriptional regulator [Desulfovibrio sp. UCD-KL4C]
MKEEDIQHMIEALQADVNLNRAAPSEIAELAKKARRLYFDKGEYIFKTGEDSNDFLLVESGRVILSKEAPSGKAFTYLIAMRGMPLNAITCFRSRLRFFSAKVAEKAVIISIPCQDFKQWVLSNSEVAAGILNAMGDRIDGAYTRILDLIDESAEKRILNVLSMLSTRIGLDLPLTNVDVSEMVGSSRETAARVISRLQEIGLVAKSRGTITILNKAELDELSSSPFFIL